MDPIPDSGQPPSRPHGRLGPAMLYPNQYTWLVFVSAMDVMLTWLILHLGGREVNWVAARVIEWGGLPAMLAFKFALVVLAIVICEQVGRRRPRLGRRLSYVMIAIGCIPLVAAAWLLGRVG